MSPANPRIGVVGHVEWVLFGYADAVPQAGEIVHFRDPFEEVARMQRHMNTLSRRMDDLFYRDADDMDVDWESDEERPRCRCGKGITQQSHERRPGSRRQQLNQHPGRVAAAPGPRVVARVGQHHRTAAAR